MRWIIKAQSNSKNTSGNKNNKISEENKKNIMNYMKSRKGISIYAVILNEIIKASKKYGTRFIKNM